MIRRLDQNDLQRGQHVGLQEVPAPGRAVAPAEDHVGVQFRLAFVERDVPDQGEHLNLLLDRYLLVLLPYDVEVPERRAGEGAYRCEGRSIEGVLPGKVRYLRDDLVPRVKHEREGLLASLLLDQLRPHANLLFTTQNMAPTTIAPPVRAAVLRSGLGASSITSGYSDSGRSLWGVPPVPWSRAIFITCPVCMARRSVLPCWIWVLQEKPSARRIVSPSASRAAGKSRLSPIFIESSYLSSSKPHEPARPQQPE